jgi:hypothetical protein
MKYLFPNTGHLVCLSKQVTQEALNNDCVGVHPETVKNQGNSYALLCRKQIWYEK